MLGIVCSKLRIKTLELCHLKIITSMDIPTSKYLFKVNNRNTRKRWELCSTPGFSNLCNVNCATANDKCLVICVETSLNMINWLAY